MFTAMVMACMINNSCLEFTDTRGPYSTEERCKQRVDEMVETIYTMPIPPITELQYKCVKLKSTGKNI